MKKIKKISELFRICNESSYDVVGKDVNYLFEEDKDTLYIYFQGSVSKWDWMRNFFFIKGFKKPYKNMEVPYRVHKGFLNAWKEVEDIIIEKITEKKIIKKVNKRTKEEESREEYKWKTIVVVGYSHGGAISGLCHECVWFNRPDLREKGLYGYGFESPRFYAGFKVRKNLKERWATYTVVRTNNDLVTHCPPCLFGYKHVGTILKVRGDCSLVTDKVPNCIKSHYGQVVYDALVKYEDSLLEGCLE